MYAGAVPEPDLPQLAAGIVLVPELHQLTAHMAKTEDITGLQ